MSAFAKLLKKAGSNRAHMTARALSVLFLTGTIMHSVLHGGILDYEGSPLRSMPDKLAGLAGLAAVDIRVGGLTHHDPQLLLQSLGVRPGGSLIGFDAGQARRQLEAMDWVASASVQRQYPNRLEINVTERVPVAIWQHDGAYSLIDGAGVVMGGLELMAQTHLPLVSGHDANLGAQQIINQLEAYPLLFQRVSAAAMVGKRRWSLYLSNGVKIALPETGVPEALAQISAVEQKTGLLQKAIRQVDLRVPGEMTVSVIEITDAKKSDPSGVQLSQKQ